MNKNPIVKTPFTISKTIQRGFTLLELMVTLAVAAVLAALAAPSFQSAIATSRLKAQANDIVGAIAMARSEAIRRGTRVTICKSGNQTSCATTGNWEQGWISFIDTTRDATATAATVDAGETVIAVGQVTNTSNVIKGSTDLANYVSFASDGRAKTMAGAAQSGTLRVCSTSSALSDAQRARDIEIIASGRTTSSTPSSITSTCSAP